VTCGEGWVKDVVLERFSDVLQVFVFKPTGEKKKVATIKPSGLPKSVQLVSPKIKVAAVSAKTQGGKPQAIATSKATNVSGTTNRAGAPTVMVAAPSIMGNEKSGLNWVNKFPTSTSLDDLKEPFKTSAKEFVAALKSAGISVKVNATYRPTERSYLMFYSAEISRGKLDATKVPSWPGVSIDWAHLNSLGVSDKKSAKAAATAMAQAFAIGGNPVGMPGKSNHNKKLAMDISLSGYVNKKIVNPDGENVTLECWGDLVSVAEDFGVKWFGSKDKPHWSFNGR
jgi:hypothetical protein